MLRTWVTVIFSPPIYYAGFLPLKVIGGRFVVIGTIMKARRRSPGCNLQRGNPWHRKPVAGIHQITNYHSSIIN
jgi:hypothetical protein